ncbi:hypothetical protein Syun_008866 [Stephania yunnanensis]|uniref:Uncharacterized protein n=1 Tax=Stephania yunnanensis TaxID=152371 RepID=A0AAP0KFY7_9MAGN
MKNTIRCCISCILPCGALDVIRVVHSNGRVEEFSQSVRASEIMKAHPKHVLRKPTSGAADEGIVPKIVVVPPDAELQRGKIYFLIPVAAPPSAQSEKNRKSSSTTTSARKKIKKREVLQEMLNNNSRSPSSTTTTTTTTRTTSSISMTSHLLSDQYLTEILSENRSTQVRDRRRGRVAVWRPHLESISETEY